MTAFPRASRSRVTTQAQDNRMKTQHLRDRKRTAARTARETRGRHGGRISKQTVLRRLKERGTQPRRPYVGPKLTRRHQQARLTWCQALESPYNLAMVSGAHFTQGTILIVILFSFGSAKSRTHQFAVGGFLGNSKGIGWRMRACRIWTFKNSV